MELRHANHILFCLRWGIGDVIIQTALLSPLRTYARRARITVLGAKPATDLLEEDERVCGVFSMDAFGLRHRWHEGEPDTQARIAAWMEEQRFDAVLDPHVTPSPVSAVLWASGVAAFESNQPAEEAALCAGGDAVAALLAGAHAGWGVPPVGATAPAVRLGCAERLRALDQLAVFGGDAEPVAFAPFASHELKRWPPERFAAVADALASDGHPILLLAAPDNDAAERVRTAMRAAAVIAPANPLKDTAALLEGCRVLIANDTGLMHLGAAVGTPTVGIFGPSDPHAYGPHGAHAGFVGGNGLDCTYRKRGTLQPPDCSGVGRCLRGLRSCIDVVDEVAVLDAVRARVASATEA